MIREPVRLGAWDVIVAGGGPAGIAAAISAARQGAKTLLLERYGILGGMLTSGHICPLLGITGPNAFIDEFVNLIRGDEMVPPGQTRNGREIYVNLEAAKLGLLEAVKKSGVQVYLQCQVIDVVKTGQHISGLIISTPTGPGLVEGKNFIDATGDGYVAFMAGAPFKVGREDGRCQPTTLEFCLEGVQADAIACYGDSDPVKLPDGCSYNRLCKEANARGELPVNVTIVRLHPTAFPGERNVNATQANGFDTLTPEGIAGAEYELRHQIPRIITFLKKYVPGYENCRVKSSATTLGVRESRRITGEYILTDNDVEIGASFEDAVVKKAWFLIDIHNPTGGGQAEKQAKSPEAYDIPYRCLLPLDVENLLTAGRCISGTHRAHASYRVMGIAFATGQAAGTAAALSSQTGKSLRELDVHVLQEALKEQGVVFS